MAATADPAGNDAALQRERDERGRRERWLAGLAGTAASRWRMAVAASVAAGWLLVPQAWALATLMDAVFVRGAGLEGSLPPLLVLGGCLAARALLAWSARDAAGDVSEAARAELRGRLWRALQAGGPRWLRRHASGALAELPLSHAEAAGDYHAGYRLARIETAWVPPVLLLAMFFADPVPGLLLLLAAPLLPVSMVLVGWGAESASRAQLGELARMGGRFADRLRGLGLIRLYGRGEAELEGIALAAEGLRVRSMRVLRIAFLSAAVLEFFASASVALVALYFGLGYLGMLPVDVAPDLGTGLFCLLLAPEFFAPMRRLGAHYHDRAAALAAAAGIESVLGLLPERTPDAPPPRAEAQPLDDARGIPDAVQPMPGPSPGRGQPVLRVQALSLASAPGASPLLEGLDLELHPGERLAVTGPSGSGKSLLLEAVAGWVPPLAGEIVVAGGVRIGLAGQRPHLFQGTLADNLRLAGDCPPADLLAAAEAAQVLRFARQLPGGLDAAVGERGFGLSGGEARRVALARALLRRPGLLLLDEPTAFLDPQTEAALLEALSRHAAGCAVLVATHSPRVMRWAGRVLDLPAGQVRPAGEVRP